MSGAGPAVSWVEGVRRRDRSGRERETFLGEPFPAGAPAAFPRPCWEPGAAWRGRISPGGSQRRAPPAAAVRGCPAAGLGRCRPFAGAAPLPDGREAPGRAGPLEERGGGGGRWLVRGR